MLVLISAPLAAQSDLHVTMNPDHREVVGTWDAQGKLTCATPVRLAALGGASSDTVRIVRVIWTTDRAGTIAVDSLTPEAARGFLGGDYIPSGQARQRDVRVQDTKPFLTAMTFYLRAPNGYENHLTFRLTCSAPSLRG